MKKQTLLFIAFCIISLNAFAQQKIKGFVFNEYLEPFYNAKITYGNTVVLSDVNGEFNIIINKFPAILEVNAFGHQTEYVDVERANQKLNIILKENLMLDQVVISASRVPERIIESPVSIERLGLTEIKKTSQNSFYDGLVNLKGVQSNEIGYGYKSVNTRGFSDFTNSRFVQLVDGMDTAAPALNFSAGNLSGVPELDINNVEILPGASSALYGANAYNGLMLMNTKNPFDFTGISFYYKGGFTEQKLAGSNQFYDAGIRMAYRFSDKFAAKVNFSYFDAEEWLAEDRNNKAIDSNEIIFGGRDLALDYDGVNVYGDEFTTITNLSNIAEFYGDPEIPSILVSRTGYTERQLLDDTRSKNVKFSTSLHFRPNGNDSLELILGSRIARGDNLLQGSAARYAQRDYYIGQHKFEIRGDNFYLRTYYTNNDAGNSYNLDITGTQMAFATQSSNTLGTWGADYYNYLFFGGANFNNIANGNLLSDIDLLRQARIYADGLSIQPGTNAFNNELNRITSTLTTNGGSKIYDKSSYTHVDGNYNFKSLLNEWADVQVGGSFRQYNPNSKGTIFNDGQKPISIDEYGIYSQIQKKLLDEKLKLTASLRYDKSENFNGNYSPRFAVNYALGEDNNHIVRASYQTGFRNPTIQEQYQYNQPGRKINIGTSRDNLDRVAIGEDIEFVGFGLVDGVISGDDIINNSLLTESVYTDFNYIKSEYNEIKPEVVKTIEVGYRSMIGVTESNNLNIDFNAFYSIHNDFVFYQDIVTPMLGKVYPFGNRPLTADELADPLIQQGRISDDGVLIWDAFAEYAFTNLGPNGQELVQEFNIVTNSKSEVKSYGASIGLSTKFLRSYDFNVNYNYIGYEYKDKDLGFFEPNFNTPKNTVKAQIGNNNLFNNFGFNVSARWMDGYRWVSPFVKGYIDERTVIDGQINYRIPSIKSKIKLGGTNLFGDEYLIAPGTGAIGKLYYLSLIIND